MYVSGNNLATSLRFPAGVRRVGCDVNELSNKTTDHNFVGFYWAEICWSLFVAHEQHDQQQRQLSLAGA